MIVSGVRRFWHCDRRYGSLFEQFQTVPFAGFERGRFAAHYPGRNRKSDVPGQYYPVFQFFGYAVFHSPAFRNGGFAGERYFGRGVVLRFITGAGAGALVDKGSARW